MGLIRVVTNRLCGDRPAAFLLTFQVDRLSLRAYLSVEQLLKDLQGRSLNSGLRRRFPSSIQAFRLKPDTPALGWPDIGLGES